MRRFKRVCAIVAVAIIAIAAIVAFVVWDMGLLRERRQPLNVNPIHTESPFAVPDRHDDTREWINERLEQAQP